MIGKGDLWTKNIVLDDSVSKFVTENIFEYQENGKLHNPYAQDKELAKANTGYIKTMWCGDLACEMKMKEEAGLSSRCMPFEQEHLSDVCPCCGKPAKTMVYWGVAY